MVKNIQVRPLEINPLGVLIAYIFIVIAKEKYIIIPKADLAISIDFLDDWSFVLDKISNAVESGESELILDGRKKSWQI